MRQIEFLEKVRVNGQTYHAGDRISFVDAEAAQYIGAGWAKDPETDEVGERVPGAARLEVENVVQPTS